MDASGGQGPRILPARASVGTVPLVSRGLGTTWEWFDFGSYGAMSSTRLRRRGAPARLLLILLPRVQGFSPSAESTAAHIMAMEYAPPGRRSLYGAVANMGSSAGQVLIAVTLLALRSMMGEGAFVSSAWRIPFVIGVGLAVVGYVLHRKATTGRPLATFLKTHRSHVVRFG